MIVSVDPFRPQPRSSVVVVVVVVVAALQLVVLVVAALLLSFSDSLNSQNVTGNSFTLIIGMLKIDKSV